jgi:hypothetical protein
VQVMVRIEGQLSPCPGSECGRQPKHWVDHRGGQLHFLECSPCGMSSTAKYPTFQQAVEEWELKRVTRVLAAK